jgi:cytochrome c oxidase subunit 3
MLFIAFTTAYLARQQETSWPAIALPPVLWANTAVLLLSSGVLEWGRWALRRGQADHLQRALRATAVLGGLFVVGQLAAWKQLAAQGIYLATNPHSAFFYLMTGVHGLHLLGGLVALAVVLVRAARGRYTPEAHGGLTAFALYWHFLDVLWVYLFVLLSWL